MTIGPGGSDGIEPSRHSVLAEWVDINRHMNVAYYGFVFDKALDFALENLGIGPSYTRSTDCGVFVLESHNLFLGEVDEGDPLEVSTLILDCDEKRIHFFEAMIHAEKGFLAATSEQLCIHMDLAARKSTAMPLAVADRLRNFSLHHRGVERPDHAGRSIAIKRR